MKLLTKAIEAKLKKFPLGSQDGKGNPEIIVKFFTPDSNWTWFVTEGEQHPSGEWEFFGLVEGHESELGYFYSSQLESIRGGFGLPVERDLHFSGCVVDLDSYPMKAVKYVKPV